MMNKIMFLSVLLFACSCSGDLYIWGGGGSVDTPYWFNDIEDEGDGLNADVDHWGIDSYPDISGADSVIISSGGVKKSKTNVDNGSYMEILGGYFWSGGCDSGQNGPGARFTIDGGDVDAQWFSGFEGSVAEIKSGWLNVRGGGDPLPTRAGGYVDFNGLSGIITAPAKSAEFLGEKILAGVIRIDGVVLTSVDEVVNGRSFIIDNTTLTLVPEPATMVIFGLGGIIALRRRK